jgi:hypothetical protein
VIYTLFSILHDVDGIAGIVYRGEAERIPVGDDGKFITGEMDRVTCGGDRDFLDRGDFYLGDRDFLDRGDFYLGERRLRPFGDTDREV